MLAACSVKELSRLRFKRASRTIDDGLVEVLGDEHHADRQAFAGSSGERYGGMAGDVEG